jgi:hypothetical protein
MARPLGDTPLDIFVVLYLIIPVGKAITSISPLEQIFHLTPFLEGLYFVHVR